MGANQQGVSTFSKGLNTDSSLLNQPEGTYIDALNITLLNDSGDYHILSNEQGTSSYVNIPANYTVIGHTVVDDAIVLCLVDTTNNYSQIGVIRDGVYTQVTPSAGDNNDLGFDINFPVDIIGRKLFNGDLIVYLTDNNEPIAVLNLDDLPTNIVKSKGIVPEVQLPIIDYDSIVTGGNLTAGVYQFMIRYLNKELVPTTSSSPTTPIPIIASREDATNTTQVYGGRYDEKVNKAIKLNISNIDIDYPFFELISIEYVGATSAPVANIVNTYDVTATTKSIVFEGLKDDSVPITIEEAINIPITYSLAKCIEQKDNRLFLSNLTESKSRYKDELQAIANDITLGYGTDTQGVGYYSDALNCVNSKGYRRGEVYSFGIAAIFKDGSTSYTYHIPGQHLTATAATGGAMGTYISADEYPLNQGYPTGGIRHHMMPTFEESPAFQNASIIDILYVGFTMGATKPSTELKSQIQGYMLFREARDTPEKKSKLSQGLITNFYRGASDYISDEVDKDSGTFRGDIVPSTMHYRKNFGFFNFKLNTLIQMHEWINDGVANSFKDKKGAHQGMYYSVSNLDETSNFKDIFISGATRDLYQKLDWRMQTDRVAFMGAETLLSDGIFLGTGNLKGAKIERMFELNTVNAQRKDDGEVSSASNREFISRAGNYNTVYSVVDIKSFTSSTSIIKFAEYVNNGEVKRVIGLDTFNLDNNYSEKFLYLKTESDIFQNTDSVQNVLDVDFPQTNGSSDFQALTEFGDVTLGGGGGFGGLNGTLDFFEINNPITNQYGNIQSSNYAPILTSFDIEATAFSQVYGGDTFITMYSIINKNLFSRYFPFRGKKFSNNFKYFKEDFKDEDNNRAVVRTSVNKNLYSPKVLPGVVYSSIGNMIVESNINTYFRFPGEDGNPYHPYNDIDAVLNALPNQEGNRNYNVQYSIENLINKQYVTRPIFDEAILGYANRTIFSERSNEDSKVDEFQLLKQENLYDLPEETGEIIDTFVWNNELYSHTPKALWRNYVNTLSKEATSIGEVVLGTGGLFTNPSQKVITSDGGYGGTLSQFGSAITPHGYFFVDLLQKKVFKLAEGLEEISLQGMHQFFDNTLVTPRLSGNYIDNTFRDAALGITMGWDNEYKRILLTQRGNSADNLTISYSPLTKSWVSFHSYIPNTYIEFDRSLLLIDNSGTTALAHTINTGAYGVYFNASIEESYVELIFNKTPVYEKVYDNINIHSSSYSPAFEEFDTFHTIECINDYQNSGILNILSTNDFDPTVANDEVVSRYKKSHHQVSLPRDNQEANLDTSDGWQSASRMKSKYLKTKLTYNNLNNNKFIVNFIEYLFRIIAR